ncbi:hypothetical protein FA95DRAFT_1296328 [Auriscalpium vulgare]|uniref:Uncharacterized protein n=1 Tax=Auriscalpium vulgare TaxID=40419 RepID=A0ACB8RTU0_9AGAM|nr:hypothetical protein FA95DRAFT_1296328 [Auriscalpium vulgare]
MPSLLGASRYVSLPLVNLCARQSVPVFLDTINVLRGTRSLSFIIPSSRTRAGTASRSPWRVALCVRARVVRKLTSCPQTTTMSSCFHRDVACCLRRPTHAHRLTAVQVDDLTGPAWRQGILCSRSAAKLWPK